MAYLELCYGAGECAACTSGSSSGRGRRRPVTGAAVPAENTGRLTPLIRTARLVEHPDHGAESLPVESAAAAQPAAPALSGAGVGAMGPEQQQASAASDAAMQEACPACISWQGTGGGLNHGGVQLGHHRPAGESGLSSRSSQADGGEAGRADEEQRRVALPLTVECSQSPTRRSQPAPTEAPEASCRPSSCRRLRFC